MRDRFVGCLLGLAVGDALGGRFEGQTADWIAARFHSARQLIEQPPVDELWYTDDTQMAIAVAESLVDQGQIVERELCRAFVENYVPSRGYGRGARRVLEAMDSGEDYRQVAATHFPGGSYGKGAAMRVAPLGLFFGNDQRQLWDEARLSALPTHTHSLGIEGAQVLASAVGLASRATDIDRTQFVAQLIAICNGDEFRGKLEIASGVQTADELISLGNGIEALESVPTAIACFTLSPTSYADVIGTAILLGGDTDTIAAMAGALSGAYLGASAIPANLLSILENQAKGRNYIEQLAHKLYEAYCASLAERG